MMGLATQKLFYINGKPVWLNREEQAVLRPGRARRNASGCYREKHPGSSTTMSCLPAQVELYRSAMKAQSISGIEWDNSGKCKITSSRARARAMPVVGRMLRLGPLHDNDGGYSDG